MRKIVVLCVMLAFMQGLNAKDKIIYLDLKEALDSPKAKEVLDSSVELKFGKGSGSNDMIIIDNLTSNRRTNGVGKSDKESCEWVLYSALKTFIARAKKEGGTKVVNIIGNFKHNEFDSKEKFQCAVGNIMSGVTLKGDIAK